MQDLSTGYAASTVHRRRRRRMSRGVLVAVVILAVLAVASGVLLLVPFVIGGSVPSAEVGDCVAQAPKAEDIQTVDCADPRSAYKVVAVIDGTRVQAAANDLTHPCAKYVDATTSLWTGKPGDAGPQPGDMGKIICLAPAK